MREVLSTKLSEFELFSTSHSYPAVTAPTETYFEEKLIDSIVCPTGYTVFQKDCKRPQGGVALFIRSDPPTNYVTRLNE